MISSKKIRLPNVTLIALGSTNIGGMVNALEYSSKEIEFGAVKLVSGFFLIHPNIKHEYIDPVKSIDEWNEAIVYKLGDYVDTDFALLVHPDGFVVNPESWSSIFLEYDYIGSPWPLPYPTDEVSYKDVNGTIRRVGNSVSLRSKRLINLAKDLKLPWKAYHGYSNEDGFICVNNVHIYEDLGMKFAPIEVAKHFGRELEIPENQNVDKPFVFHMADVESMKGRNKQYESLII